MALALPLTDRTLRLHSRRVAVPRYGRRALRPAVVHLSVGSFHRSHQAVYFDELACAGDKDWGITGVGLRSRAMAEALIPQQGLYTVVSRHGDGDRPRVIGVMPRYLFAPDAPGRVVAAIGAEDTKLVTLTLTGAGYVPPTAGSHPGPSALALIVAGLDAHRRARRTPPTVVSCDNLPANGDVARAAVVAEARRSDEHLGHWIEEHVAFPSSVVDRITPKTTDEDCERLAREFGVRDRWPVMTEPSRDWVIEDRFGAERPPLDEVGVRFVDDVRPYALIKTRMLNALHLVLGALGGLAGYRTVPQLMADPVFRAYADRLLEHEIAPSLPSAGMDLDAYRRSLLQRLANPTMQDQLERLCRDVSHKFPRHVVPSLLAARDDARPRALLVLATAGICRRLRGIDDLGRPLELDDEAGPRLRALALAGGDDPRLLLSERRVFGALGEDEDLVRELRVALADLDRDGTRRTLARAVSGHELATA